MSLPSWECGLKYLYCIISILFCNVAPFVGVWIEICYTVVMHFLLGTSLPSWECGLKYIIQQLAFKIHTVAPFVGVWIEIFATSDIFVEYQSLPSWECGLK